ncbi:MAG: NADH-quinone oxidoreductase subunit A [Planctomycetaceae bacterium]|jgi:NADH-quinone oxidoreductase subunit A|nr:NADH-quinone oxidoreductase subunit A [Planctomycetaceae bacterium]MBT6155482.1 NADH-quinone oxidoreductase subunit A [Planctomycetaceae bacterium]MBT6483676.1 NADH-quinone oxidoreductase subunit A [Planctomycetaceae bacterium]MBT6496281.1 NADH-quinone oxidoreductase subunit A [Planctomycetaceae bacterium]
MTDLVGHFLLFGVIAVGFLMVPLLIGRFLRPKLPTPEKDAIYECGEPTIGSSYVQFDLRFYVVALLFIIFDVEVAFFFPWAMVFGGATQLADPTLTEPARQELTAKLLNVSTEPSLLTLEQQISSTTASSLAMVGLCDILVFFGVLLVGFAYVWKRGDLDWVRAVAEKARKSAVFPRPPTTEQEPVADTITT